MRSDRAVRPKARRADTVLSPVAARSAERNRPSCGRAGAAIAAANAREPLPRPLAVVIWSLRRGIRSGAGWRPVPAIARCSTFCQFFSDGSPRGSKRELRASDFSLNAVAVPANLPSMSTGISGPGKAAEGSDPQARGLAVNCGRTRALSVGVYRWRETNQASLSDARELARLDEQETFYERALDGDVQCGALVTLRVLSPIADAAQTVDGCVDLGHGGAPRLGDLAHAMAGDAVADDARSTGHCMLSARCGHSLAGLLGFRDDPNAFRPTIIRMQAGHRLRRLRCSPRMLSCRTCRAHVCP